MLPHPIPSYRFWSYYLKQGIVESGMSWEEVPEVDWAAGLVPYEKELALGLWKAEAWERTLQYIKTNRQQVDVFLCYLYPKQIDISAIKSIRALGVPCVNFYCDHVREFSVPPLEFKVFDLIWVPEFEALEMYEKARINHIHLPMPMWVAPDLRSIPTRESGKIAFIGSKDTLRSHLLAAAIGKGLDLQIRGEGWIPDLASAGKPASSAYSTRIRNQVNLLSRIGIKAFLIHQMGRGKVTFDAGVPDRYIFTKPDFVEYIELTRNSNIVLGINRVPAQKDFRQRAVVYSRLRDIEAPMLGACYLTEYTEGLRGLYELGRDIETYRDADELTARCREIGNSVSLRNTLRRSGQKKALSALSIPRSLDQLKKVLFNGPAI
jgi:hypothetical protein